MSIPSAPPPAPRRTADAEVLMTLDRVSFAHPGGFTALCDVSLTIRRGDAIAVLGANGCGKSTLLHVLGGQLFPDSGEFDAFGSPLVGVITQRTEPALGWSSVRETLADVVLRMGVPTDAAAARVAATLQRLDIVDLADRAPSQLSGGEQRRVAIGAVLVGEPDVLIVDEPTSALDPRTQQWLVELLVGLHATGTTLIVATHDLLSVHTLADRCIVLGPDHRIAADGPPADIVGNRDLLLSVRLIHEHAHVHVVQDPRGAAREVVHSHDHDAAHHSPGDHETGHGHDHGHDGAHRHDHPH